MAILVKTLDDLDELQRVARQHIDNGKPINVDIEVAEKQRTLPQNKSLHKYCDLLAIKMNEAGFTQRKLVGQFKEGFELPVTEHMIKDIFREVGKAMFKKESTADLTTIETQKVYEVVDNRFREITGICVDWPSKESQANNALGVRR